MHESQDANYRPNIGQFFIWFSDAWSGVRECHRKV